MQLVAGLFDNAMLLSEVEERSRLQQELVELAASLAAPARCMQIAEEAARHLREVTGANDCDVWWLEEGYLRCLASVDGNGVDEDAWARLSTRLFPSTARPAEDREPLVFATLDDPRITEYEREDLEALRVHSAFSCRSSAATRSSA